MTLGGRDAAIGNKNFAEETQALGRRSVNIGVWRACVRREKWCSDSGQGEGGVVDVIWTMWSQNSCVCSGGGYLWVSAFLHPLPSHSCALSVALHGS